MVLLKILGCNMLQALYESRQCTYLLDESDSLPAYEERARNYPSSHDAAVAALGSIDHVQQVEAIHREWGGIIHHDNHTVCSSVGDHWHHG